MLWTLILAFCLALVSIGVALRFGGAPERAAGWILLMMLIVPWVIRWLGGKSFSTVDPAAFATDVLALIGFVAIALTADRYWPLWVSSLQLLSVAAHIIRWLDIEVEPLVYAVMSGGPSYAISLLVLMGAVNHHRQRQRIAEMESLRSLSRPSTPGTRG